MLNFNSFLLEAGDNIWVLHKGELIAAEVMSVSVFLDIITYHAKCLEGLYKDKLFDFGNADVGLLVWKDKQTAIDTINSVKFEEVSAEDDNND